MRKVWKSSGEGQRVMRAEQQRGVCLDGGEEKWREGKRG